MSMQRTLYVNWSAHRRLCQCGPDDTGASYRQISWNGDLLQLLEQRLRVLQEGPGMGECRPDRRST